MPDIIVTYRKILKVMTVLLLSLFIVAGPLPTAEAEVQVIPQTVRVCLAQKITGASFMVNGKYRLVDNSSGKIITLPDEGKRYSLQVSGNRINILAGNEPQGSFVGPLNLEAIKDRVHIMSGNGSLVQKDSAEELAIQSAENDIRYSGGRLFELWAQGKDNLAALRPESGLNLVDVSAGDSSNTYRGDFEFRNTGGGLTVINKLGIEEYLYGVVSAEMQASFPLEAIKAQAVAARTYLISSLGNYSVHGYDILATQNSQVYKGHTTEHSTGVQGVNATRGEVMIFRGRPIFAFFHASSGGYTENSEDIWNAELPYMRAKPDPLDKNNDNPHYNWSVTYSQQELVNKLAQQNHNFQVVSDIQVEEFTSSGKRVKRLCITGIGENGSPKTISVANGDNVRYALGLKSAMFSLEKKVDEQGRLSQVTLRGNGWGHGLGLSQWGARGMAGEGYNYRDILQYYYTGVSIVNNYGK